LDFGDGLVVFIAVGEIFLCVWMDDWFVFGVCDVLCGWGGLCMLLMLFGVLCVGCATLCIEVMVDFVCVGVRVWWCVSLL